MTNMQIANQIYHLRTTFEADTYTLTGFTLGFCSNLNVSLAWRAGFCIWKGQSLNWQYMLGFISRPLLLLGANHIPTGFIE